MPFWGEVERGVGKWETLKWKITRSHDRLLIKLSHGCICLSISYYEAHRMPGSSYRRHIHFIPNHTHCTENAPYWNCGALLKDCVIWRWDGRWKRDEGERPGFKKSEIRRKDGSGKEEEEEPAMRGQLLPGKGFLRHEHIFGTCKKEHTLTHSHFP